MDAPGHIVKRMQRYLRKKKRTAADAEHSHPPLLDKLTRDLTIGEAAFLLHFCNAHLI